MSIFSKRRRRAGVPQGSGSGESGAAPAASETWVIGPGQAGPAPAHEAGAGGVRPSAGGPVPWPPGGETGAAPEAREGPEGEEDGSAAAEGANGSPAEAGEVEPPADAGAQGSAGPGAHDDAGSAGSGRAEEREEAVPERAPETAAVGANGGARSIDPARLQIRTLVDAVRAAREASVERRLESLSALDGIDDPEVHEVALAALTHDLSEAIRSRAILLLAAAPAHVRIEALRIASEDPQPAIRTSALERLVGETDEDAAAPLVLRLVDDPDDRVAQTAGEVLIRRIGSDLATVWAALKRSTGSRRERLKVVLAGERPEELERLRTDRAASPDPEDRALAAELVPARDEHSAADAGLRLLRDPSGRVRAAATRSLARLRTDEVTEALREALVDPNPSVRLEAVRGLVQRDDASTIDALIDRLSDPDVRIRAAVLEGLEGRASRGLANRLIGALEDARLREGAIELLVAMDRFAEPLLLDALEDRGGSVRDAIGTVLEQVLGVDELGRRLTSVDRDERETALEALSAIGTPASTGQVLRSLDDPDEDIRLRAVRHLGVTDDARAIAALRATAERDPVRRIAEVAAEALAGHDIVLDQG